jgi:hypothetical protein
MEVREARLRLDEATRHFADGRFEAAEALCSAVIAGLPQNGEGHDERVEAYEALITLRFRERRTARALRLFGQYVENGAPACDTAYDQSYRDGLLATQTSPVPLQRRERFHSLVQLFRRTLSLQGLVAECGCFRGLSSYLLCCELKRAERGFDGQGYRIFDSFQGLSAPQPEDAVDDSDPQADKLRQMTRPGQFSAALQDVREALSAFPRIGYFPGWIPEAFPDEPAARYRFVHVDVDVHQPTRDSLEYFYPKLVAGGILVCDDYGWPGARKAVDDFSAKTGARFITTPHLQAYCVRGA